MQNLTQTFSKEQLDGITGKTPLTTPSVTYLALFTADPTETGSVANEVTNQGYARKSLSGLFPSATSTTVSNSDAIVFDIAKEDWETITHVGIMKSGVTGTADMMLHIALDSNITILSTQSFKFTPGAFIISTGCATPQNY